MSTGDVHPSQGEEEAARLAAIKRQRVQDEAARLGVPPIAEGLSDEQRIEAEAARLAEIRRRREMEAQAGAIPTVNQRKERVEISWANRPRGSYLR